MPANFDQKSLKLVCECLEINSKLVWQSKGIMLSIYNTCNVCKSIKEPRKMFGAHLGSLGLTWKDFVGCKTNLLNKKKNWVALYSVWSCKIITALKLILSFAVEFVLELGWISGRVRVINKKTLSWTSLALELKDQYFSIFWVSRLNLLGIGMKLWSCMCWTTIVVLTVFSLELERSCCL